MLLLSVHGDVHGDIEIIWVASGTVAKPNRRARWKAKRCRVTHHVLRIRNSRSCNYFVRLGRFLDI